MTLNKGMKNFLTGGGVPMALTRLAYTTPVSVDSTQLPFHATQALRGGSSSEDTLTIDGCAPLTDDGSDTMAMEIRFLDLMGLLVRGPDGRTLYASPLTALFYRGGMNALFGMDLNVRLSALMPPERTEFLRPLLNLMAHYTLPGRMAWLRAVKAPADSLQLRTRMDQELQEMDSIIQRIQGGL
jgi:hypothetical protein